MANMRAALRTSAAGTDVNSLRSLRCIVCRELCKLIKSRPAFDNFSAGQA